MQTTTFPGKKFLTAFSLFLFILVNLFLLSCRKTVDPSATVEQAEELSGKRRPTNPPPPPPSPPAFWNCANPTYSATFTVGKPTNISITKNYVNGTGGSYAAFTSSTVNGITFSTPAGTLNTGSGTVVFTATGTPLALGYYSVSNIKVGNIASCTFYFAVTNAPVSGPTTDPSPAVGSTGVVNFTYKGQSVAYKTVRAGDGKIWLQQNLGSPQVAFHHLDEASYGDYFQWGRWDDGHQAPNSQSITAGPALLNPSHIPSGNSNFIRGPYGATKWWSSGGSITDTWSGTVASSTNGKDPCVALGAGWRLPRAADWQNVMNFEDFAGTMNAFQSRLKLPAAGYRLSDGMVFRNGDNGHYWSGTASTGNYGKVFTYDDNSYDFEVRNSERAQGYPCRCVKD
jgi:uncharacterized protein (TIGR02145 family)